MQKINYFLTLEQIQGELHALQGMHRDKAAKLKNIIVLINLQYMYNVNSFNQLAN